MKRSTFSNIEQLIENWALWARRNIDIVQGYPKQSAIARLVATPDTRPDIAIDDDTALAIDTAIGALLRRDREIGEALIVYASTGGNAVHAARLLKISRAQISSRKEAGLAWLDGTLSAVAAIG